MVSAGIWQTRYCHYSSYCSSLGWHHYYCRSARYQCGLAIATRICFCNNRHPLRGYYRYRYSRSGARGSSIGRGFRYSPGSYSAVFYGSYSPRESAGFAPSARGAFL